MVMMGIEKRHLEKSFLNCVYLIIMGVETSSRNRVGVFFIPQKEVFFGYLKGPLKWDFFVQANNFLSDINKIGH